MTAYQPDVRVELAFGSGYSTPAASRTWTDVSQWLEADQGISINFGRGDELSSADANILSLTLDNSDGRFTALRAASPYYPNVKIGVPIRVTTTPVGGVASVRYVGYVEEWPVEWDGSDNYAKATITASSRLARLGLNTSLRSIVEESVLAANPVLYYTLGESKNATSASDSSGSGASRLVMRGRGADVVFGTATGPGTDGLTAATFAGGRYLEGGIRSGGTTSESSVVFFNRSGMPSAQENLFLGGAMTDIRMDTSGRIVGFAGTSSTSYADGNTHCAAAVFEVPAFGPNNAYLYVDGVLVASTNGGGGGSVTVRVGGPDSGGVAFTGVLAHAASFNGALSATQVADIARAGRDGFAGETTAARLQRYASFARVPAAEVDAETGSTTIGHIDTTGKTVEDLLRQMEVTEGGVLFDDRDGTLTLHNRSHRYDPTTTLALDMAAQTIGADFAPKLDRTGVVNDVSATNADGTITAHVVDQASKDDIGTASASIETASQDDDEPFAAASWRLNASKSPKSRVASLSVNLLDFTAAPSQDDVLAATVGTHVTVANQPTQAAETTGSYFLEGYSETITGTSYDLSLNVSPADPYTRVFKIEYPSLGALDGTAVIAY